MASWQLYINRIHSQDCWKNRYAWWCYYVLEHALFRSMNLARLPQGGLASSIMHYCSFGLRGLIRYTQGIIIPGCQLHIQLTMQVWMQRQKQQ